MILFDNNNGDGILGGDQVINSVPQKPQTFEAEQFAGLDLLGGSNNNQTKEPMFNNGTLVLQAYNDSLLEILFNCQMVNFCSDKISMMGKRK